MKNNVSKSKSISPENAMKILAKYGTIVTTEEAKMILEFIIKIAKLSMDQSFKK